MAHLVHTILIETIPFFRYFLEASSGKPIAMGASSLNGCYDLLATPPHLGKPESEK